MGNCGNGETDHEGEVGTRLERARVHSQQTAARHDPETRNSSERQKNAPQIFPVPRHRFSISRSQFVQRRGRERVWSIEYNFETNKKWGIIVELPISSS